VAGSTARWAEAPAGELCVPTPKSASNGATSGRKPTPAARIRPLGARGSEQRKPLRRSATSPAIWRICLLPVVLGAAVDFGIPGYLWDKVGAVWLLPLLYAAHALRWFANSHYVARARLVIGGESAAKVPIRCGGHHLNR
jgi:hypothetical protein